MQRLTSEMRPVVLTYLLSWIFPSSKGDLDYEKGVVQRPSNEKQPEDLLSSLFGFSFPSGRPYEQEFVQYVQLLTN